MDIEHDNSIEPYDDDIAILPQNHSPLTPTCETISDREPLSKCKEINWILFIQ